MGSVEMSRNWLELPAELTASILVRVGPFDMLSARKVCKRWRQICSEPQMWRVLDMRDLSCNIVFDVNYVVQKAVDLSCGQLIEFSIDYFADNDMLRYVSSRSSQLRRICLVSCLSVTTDGWSEMVKKLPLLEELHLHHSCIYKKAIEVAGRCCPQLKSFKLNQRYMFSLEGCDKDALAIAENMPGLRHLQLIGNTMTMNGLLAIIKNCPHLESLDIRHCLNITNLEPDLVRRLSQQMKDLRLPDDSIQDYEYNDLVDLDSSDEDAPCGLTMIRQHLSSLRTASI